MSAKPTISIAHVEGSGTGGALEGVTRSDDDCAVETSSSDVVWPCVDLLHHERGDDRAWPDA